MATNDEPESYDPSFVPHQHGLNNTGALCHLNSLLQGLAGCSAVVRAAFASRDYLGRTATGRAFYDFVYAAAAGARPPGSAPLKEALPVDSCSASLLQALVADLRLRRPGFRYGPNQESASEGLVLLLDMMDDPDPRLLGDPETAAYEENPIARLFYHRYDARVFCRRCKACVSQELDVAIQFNLFYYDALSKKPRSPAEFGEMLRTHVSCLENYRCGECGEAAGGLRHYRLRMVPEVLVCLFDLYDDRCTRVARYFPTRVLFPGVGGAQLVYRQVSQVEQSGCRGGGHYVARSLRADGQVYRFDDASVAPSVFGPTPDVYMVFYHCERVLPAALSSG